MTTNGSQGADNAQASSGNEGIVYVLTNPAMPGLVKIGKTTQDDVTTRIRQLFTTEVPYPFECAYAVKVRNYSQVEKALHAAFDPYRAYPANTRREFFKIEPEQARAILELIKIEDVTPQETDSTQDTEGIDDAGANEIGGRRPNVNFGDLRIPVGAELKFTRKEATATVVDDRSTVRYEGEEFAISLLTGRLMEASYYIGPGRYWTYKGRLLRDIYNEFHGS